jgi:broad specificity phosphatase PhoE
MDIYLIRHGEYRVAESFRGQVDGPLNGLGVQQAEAAARRLHQERVAVVYSSDMKRAQQTAEIIRDMIGAEVRVREGLREINRGEWESRDPNLPEYAEFRKEWDRHGRDTPYPGGECGQDVIRRAYGVLDEIVENVSEVPVAVVAHGGVIRSLIAACSGLGQEKRFQWEIARGSVSTVRYDGKAFSVVRINDTEHVRAQGSGE